MLAVALIVFGMRPSPAHAAAPYPEEAVKAIFLYRFAGYVTWPASTANAPQFTIAVLGAANVAEQLKEFLPAHPIQGRPARVATIQGLSQLGDAQMLYIGPGVTGRLSVLIEALKDRPVLIVTDQPGALEEGSTVNFLLEEQHVRFEISTAAAKRSGLSIGSDLLAVAQRVKTARRIRDQLWGGETALFALTGWGLSKDVEGAKAAGFNEHMTKPVDIARLAVSLANHSAQVNDPAMLQGYERVNQWELRCDI
jgi:hypothetical protein